MDIVINTSPLIFLYKIKRLEVLNKLFDNIYVPQAVLAELDSGNPDETTKILSAIPYKSLKVTNRIAVLGLLGRLHVGEVEAIIGAIEKGVKHVVLDDLYARNKAKQLKLEVTGTLGIIIMAKKTGLIENIHNDIKALTDAGMYISNKLIESILRE